MKCSKLLVIIYAIYESRPPGKGEHRSLCERERAHAMSCSPNQVALNISCNTVATEWDKKEILNNDTGHQSASFKTVFAVKVSRPRPVIFIWSMNSFVWNPLAKMIISASDFVVCANAYGSHGLIKGRPRSLLHGNGFARISTDLASWTSFELTRVLI